MTTIADKLTTLNDIKTDIKTALSSKGATPTNDFTTYAGLVDKIPYFGKYKPLDRVKDDNNNEIGTVSGLFTDGNGVEYAVVCLDAKDRLDANNSQWCSNTDTAVTDLPNYRNGLSSYWYSSAETATYNTQKILDFCSDNSYTSASCTHCRSKSYTIDGVTYYGQMPNAIELFDIVNNMASINAKDITASSYSSVSFASARSILASNQFDATRMWVCTNAGITTADAKNKTNTFITVPILEIPNS